MKLLNCIVLGLLLSLAPLPAWAGAYDQLVGMAGGAGNVPSVPDPSPSEYQGYNNTSYSNENNNSYDYAAAEERRRVRQIERERKARQRTEARKKRERKRRDDREDKEDLEWKKKQELRQVTLQQLPPSWQLKSKPGTGSGNATGKSGGASNMSDFAHMQKQIAELRKQGGKDSQIAELEAKVLQLWGKVISSCSSPDRASRMLRLPVGITADNGSPVPHLSQAMLVKMLQTQTAYDQQIMDDLHEGLVPVKTGLVNFARDYLQEVVSGAPANIVEAATEGEMSALVKDLPVIAKITMAFREDDMASGLATVADYVVGRVPLPQASIAETGRKIYVNVALESLNNFMDKASGAVGMTHDRKVFWQELKQQATVGQRAFMEWLGVKSEK